MSPPLLKAVGVTRDYPGAGGLLRRGMPRRVLHGIDLQVETGETLGIIGGSGSGKTTLARILMGLEPPTTGHVRFRGDLLHGGDRTSRRRARLQIQAVFQDPYSSLDPRQRIGRILAEPLLAHDVDPGTRRQRVREALEAIALPADTETRYPHEFSGGQRQRIAIARALVTRPALVIADEPVSALDVSVQAQVLNLMLELRDRLGLAYVLISHDLGVIRHMSHRVAVLEAGRIAEQGDTAAVLASPRHPATRSLIASLPKPPLDPRPAS